MTLFMGIDGGGSNLRVVLVDEHLHEVARAERTTANPSTIGRDASAALLQSAIRETLSNAAHPIVTAAAIGIAGAPASRSESWLREVVSAALPDTLLIPSSDMEIALVGARGERFGILLLSGTGSVALGIDQSGTSLQVGGWGYLLGDEGSGFWIGLTVLRQLVQRADEDAELTSLDHRILDTLNLETPKALVSWIYQGTPPVREVARLVELVLDEAAQNEVQAQAIVEQAALDLVRLVHVTRARLGQTDLPLAFAGGLLSSDNPLSRRVCAHLGLSALPVTLYTPAVGAALLAKLMWKG